MKTWHIESIWEDSPNDSLSSPVTPGRLRSARHEACHACLAEILHIPLDSVSIRPTKGADGHTSLGKHVQAVNLAKMPVDKRKEYAARLLMVALGGLVSGWVYDRQKRYADCQEDMQVYQQVINAVPVPAADQETVFDQLFDEATKIIRSHREIVDAVADALASKGVLTGTQVGEIVRRVADNANKR